MFLHVRADHVCHLLVEPPEENGTNHHRDIQTHSGQETGAFQRYVRGTDCKRLSRAVPQGKQVIAEMEQKEIKEWSQMKLEICLIGGEDF